MRRNCDGFCGRTTKNQKKHDAICVIVDRLTKSAHFIPINITFSLEQLAMLYVREIIRLHGVPRSIISDRDSRFTLTFWRKVKELLGTKLKFSTAFHPQTDGQTGERFKHLKICFEHVLWISKEHGINTYH